MKSLLVVLIAVFSLTGCATALQKRCEAGDNQACLMQDQRDQEAAQAGSNYLESYLASMANGADANATVAAAAASAGSNQIYIAPQQEQPTFTNCNPSITGGFTCTQM